VEIKWLPIRETYERLHSGLDPETFIAYAVGWTHMDGISRELDLAHVAEIQLDPAQQPVPTDLPGMRSITDLGREIRVHQRTTIG
jgi:hypothetical protein